MYAQSAQVLSDESIDIVCYLVDLSRAFGEEEDAVAHLAEKTRAVVCVVFNKTDLCESPHARREEFMRRYPALAVRASVSLSATAASAKNAFLEMLVPLVRPGPQYYPDDELTDADMRFLAAEFVRKRTIEATREEVPHAVFVEILSYKELSDRHDIDAVIHVETDGQKGIVIGEKGRLVTRIRKSAQKDMARFIGTPVSLRCHVRVSPKWRDDLRFLREMGLAGAG
jgi:GTP-binding protein Era